MRNSIRTFDAKNAHIRDALMRNLAARTPRSAEQTLKSEKVMFGILLSQSDEK